VSNTGLEVTRKKVDDMLVASVRFVGQPPEVGNYFRKLVEHVEPHIVGKGLTLYHGGSAEDGYDIEVCFPVSRPVNEGDVTSRTLEGEKMLCAVYHGPYRSDDDEKCIGTTWKKLWGHTERHEFGVTEGPYREVYLEDDIDHGDDVGKYVTEIQIPLMLPVWLGRFTDGLDQHAGESVRRKVMAGSEAVTDGSTPAERIAWIRRAMERLDATVPDQRARARIMYGCAHRFPQPTIDRIRAEYERLGSREKLLRFLSHDPKWRGARFERDPDGAPNVLYVEKIPARRKAYESATNDAEKRAAYCHCPFVRDAIRKGESISETFCNCGAGWFVRFWEGVVGETVEVEVVKSALQGDDRCRFAIHLPEE
jgi:effector-binding domain-containing protein